MNEIEITEESNIKYYVYKTTNMINGRFYIGVHQSKDINNDKYLGSGKLLKLAIKKHGRKNFKREILFEFNSSEEAYEKELEIVNYDFLKEHEGNIYNVGEGGNGGRVYSVHPWLGKTHTEEEKQKISEGNKGKICTEEQRLNLSIKQKERMKNMPQEKKEEIYKKVSITMTGKPCSDEKRQKCHDANIGKIISQETRIKISKANKGKGNPRLAEINRDPEKIRKTVEKTKGKYKGVNSVKFSGYWVTPFGKFDTIENAAINSSCSISVTLKRCKRQNLLQITKKHVHRNSCLTINDIGKTWKELGWGFDPVAKDGE